MMETDGKQKVLKTELEDELELPPPPPGYVWKQHCDAEQKVATTAEKLLPICQALGVKASWAEIERKLPRVKVAETRNRVLSAGTNFLMAKAENLQHTHRDSLEDEEIESDDDDDHEASPEPLPDGLAAFFSPPVDRIDFADFVQLLSELTTTAATSANDNVSSESVAPPMQLEEQRPSVLTMFAAQEASLMEA